MKLAVIVLLTCSLSNVGAIERLFPHLRKSASQAKESKEHHKHAHASGKHHAAKAKPAEVPAVEAAAAVEAPTPVVMPEVPPAANVGDKGYPELPGVSTMLMSATEKAKAMSSQAGILQASIARAQQESEAKLAQQKHVYEKKLRVQETQNKASIAVNAEITQEINKLKLENEDLRNASKTIRGNNMVMRSELLALKERLGGARSFVVASLAATQETAESKEQVKVATLKKVQATATKATASKKQQENTKKDDDDEDDEDDDDDDDSNSTAPANGTSLLELKQAVRRTGSMPEDPLADDDDDSSKKMNSMDAKDLLAVLQQGVATLTAEEKKSEKQLKDLFLHNFKMGTKRHSALITEQKHLNATRASLTTTQEKLKTTKQHLEGTNGMLTSRLHGLGNFLQQLSHLAKVPTSEASKMMEDLPSSVTISE